MSDPSNKTFVARLDPAGVFLGLDEIDADALTAAHVHLPTGCDLPPGQYRWDSGRKAFLPLHNPQAAAMEQPLAQNALAGLILGLDASGFAVPLASLRWLDWFITTVDFAADDLEKVRAYARKRGVNK